MERTEQGHGENPGDTGENPADMNISPLEGITHNPLAVQKGCAENWHPVLHKVNINA